MHPALFASITPDSTLHELPTENVEVPITFPIPRLAELFEARPGLAGVMIVDDVGFVGMLSRQTFTQEMARPHRRDLLRRRMVGELYRSLNPSALRLPSDTRIDDALKIALNRTDNRRYEPIVVDYRDQRPRLLDVYVLLLGQTAQLSAQNAACRAAVDTARAAEAKYRAIFENPSRASSRPRPKARTSPSTPRWPACMATTRPPSSSRASVTSPVSCTSTRSGGTSSSG
jgi:hypothetical protein